VVLAGITHHAGEIANCKNEAVNVVAAFVSNAGLEIGARCGELCNRRDVLISSEWKAQKQFSFVSENSATPA
jgi:hypothetical protein